ncbi:MAG: hypothetical protein ABH896_01890 [Candidatus Jacksonbacteria bacterium]
MGFFQGMVGKPMMHKDGVAVLSSHHRLLWETAVDSSARTVVKIGAPFLFGKN